MSKMKRYIEDLSEQIDLLSEDYCKFDNSDMFVQESGALFALTTDPIGVVVYLNNIIANVKGCDHKMFERAYGLKRKVEEIC